MGTMTIKEAAKRLQVEAYVLRYWEDELKLDIKRNAQGHRYYDERDIRMFEQVKTLKNDGMMLKDIRNAIMQAKRILNEKAKQDTDEDVTGNGGEELKKDVPDSRDEYKNESEMSGEDGTEANDPSEHKGKDIATIHKLYDEDSMVERMERVVTENEKVVDFKQAQLQTVMNRVIANALRENKDIITTSIKQEVTADVMRQFDVVMREKEEREEARYRRLDEVLREIQHANEEVAATKVHKRFGKKRR